MSLYANDALTMAFRDVYQLAAFDGRSVLEQAGVCEMARGDHAIYNYEGLDTMTAPAEITTKNSVASVSPITANNRMMITKVYYKEVSIDDVADIKETIADPKSKLVQQFMNWFNLINDRDGIAAALGTVLIGSPSAGIPSVPTAAADDGVVTIDATAGLTDTVVNKIVTKFINLETGDNTAGAAFICTGTEQAELLALETEINRFYLTADGTRKNLVGTLRNLINVFNVAGSDAETTVPAARLRIPESYGTRVCPVIQKGGLYSKFGIDKVVYTKDNPNYANSDTLKVIFRVGHMRTQGQKVLGIQTTIES
jgi:hypothetical protein